MDKPYVVGIDIGGQSAKIGIVDTRGTVLSQTAIKSNDTNSHVEFIDNLCTAVEKLVEKANELGGKHGVGIADMVENRLVGMKSRGVYETPGGTILYTAIKELEYLCLDRQTMHYKELIASKYAELVYDGLWFTPLREAIDAFVNVCEENVTGTVRLKLYKGQVTPAGAKSPYSLYNEDIASFGDSKELY